jgi:hypothetical protein
LYVHLSVCIVRGCAHDLLSKGCTCPKWKESLLLFFSFTYALLIRDTPPNHAATPVGCRLGLCSLPLPSPLPAAVAVPESAARSLWSPCSIPPLLSLYLHESMAGRPSPTATRRMHGRLWGRARAVRLAGSAPFSSMSVYQSEGNMPRRREVCTTALPTSDVERNPHCVSFSC